MKTIHKHNKIFQRTAIFVCSLTFLVAGYSPTIMAMTENDYNALSNNTPFYNPQSNCATANAFTGISINNAAAEAAAKKDSTGGVNIGYALYSTTGPTLTAYKEVASYNSTFENYGASVTKVMILIAYLDQLGAAAPSPVAQSVLTGMIEDSNDTDANTAYAYLNNPDAQIQTIANDVGSGGFKLNSTGDSLYRLGQSQVTADFLARLFSKIDNTSMFPAESRNFALTLLSNITPYEGLLQSGLPGIVYSKEGWKPEPGGAPGDPPISGNANPFGMEGAPYIVNQGANFTNNTGTPATYGVAVTVAGVADEATGASDINDVVTALIGTGASNTTDSETCTCSQGTVSLTGSDNEQKIWNYFKSIGLADTQVAGIMGNIEQESSFNPEEVQGGGQSQDPNAAGGGGWGLVQWTPGASVLEAAKANTVSGPIYELATQLQLIEAEMTGTSPVGQSNIQKTIKGMNDAATVAEYFDKSFEGGTDPGGIRETYAIEILNTYKGTGPQSGENTSSCSSGSPDCNTAQGDTKILCEALQYNPASYSESVAGDHYPIVGSPPPSPGGGGNLTWLKTCPQINASCTLDCSGLVNISVYDAFGYNEDNNTYSEATDSNWKHIPFSQVQPGDLIQPGEYAGGHVEIIDHVSGQTIYTFGAHDPDPPQADEVGPASYQASGGDVYLHWVGPT